MLPVDMLSHRNMGSRWMKPLCGLDCVEQSGVPLQSHHHLFRDIPHLYKLVAQASLVELGQSHIRNTYYMR